VNDGSDFGWAGVIFEFFEISNSNHRHDLDDGRTTLKKDEL
jgi:hypothetical protein